MVKLNQKSCEWFPLKTGWYRGYIFVPVIVMTGTFMFIQIMEAVVFRNTDFAALLIAIVALVSPVIVELLRNSHERKARELDNQHRERERKEDFEQRDKERKEEYENRASELDKSKKDNYIEKIEQNKRNNVYEYIKEINKFYEAITKNSVGNQKPLLSIKNSSSEIFNKLIVDFSFSERWKYQPAFSSDNTEFLKSCFTEILELSGKFYIGFLNVSDNIQSILQSFCDDREFDSQSDFLLRYHLETLQALLPIVFIDEVDDSISEKVKKNITIISERFNSNSSTRNTYIELQRQPDESVPNYFKRIFNNKDSEGIKKEIKDKVKKELESKGQFRRIHTEISETGNKKNYLELSVDGNTYFINKNCNRDVAEQFVFDLVKEIKEIEEQTHV